MSNIYLRLPSVVCAFHRNRDRNHMLRPEEPVKYRDSSEHNFIMRSGLETRVGFSTRKSPRCYSQNEWNKILQGIAPNGSNDVKVERNPADWPTYKEICMLEGRKLTDRSESYDFLCIRIPETVTINGNVKRTNHTYSLARKEAETLISLLIVEFNHALQEWEADNYEYCNTPDENGNIIVRSFPNILERFLLSYDIPISKSARERDSLIRQMTRWRGFAKQIMKKNYDFDITFTDSADVIQKPKFST